MSTHNRLLNISSPRFPLCFFEVIAIDPEAPPPGRARWFGLDALDLRAGPRLVNVVARTKGLDRRLEALRAAGARPGEALAASRPTPAGLLTWRIAVEPDGRLDGALPTLIEWDDETQHPATRLASAGVTLARVRLAGLRPAVAAALDLAEVDVAGPSEAPIEVELDTPRGRVTLQATMPANHGD